MSKTKSKSDNVVEWRRLACERRFQFRETFDVPVGEPFLDVIAVCASGAIREVQHKRSAEGIVRLVAGDSAGHLRALLYTVAG